LVARFGSLDTDIEAFDDRGNKFEAAGGKSLPSAVREKKKRLDVRHRDEGGENGER
jgi:hypothetical protein